MGSLLVTEQRNAAAEAAAEAGYFIASSVVVLQCLPPSLSLLVPQCQCRVESQLVLFL